MKLVTIPFPRKLFWLMDKAHDYNFLGTFVVLVSPWGPNVDMAGYTGQWWVVSDKRESFASASIDIYKGISLT